MVVGKNDTAPGKYFNKGGYNKKQMMSVKRSSHHMTVPKIQMQKRVAIVNIPNIATKKVLSQKMGSCA